MSAVAAPSQRSVIDVRLDRLTKRFDDVVAVDGSSLDIGRGAFFALLGPSGCGKTTTLRMIGGFEEPTPGGRSPSRCSSGGRPGWPRLRRSTYWGR